MEKRLTNMEDIGGESKEADNVQRNVERTNGMAHLPEIANIVPMKRPSAAIESHESETSIQESKNEEKERMEDVVMAENSIHMNQLSNQPSSLKQNDQVSVSNNEEQDAKDMAIQDTVQNENNPLKQEQIDSIAPSTSNENSGKETDSKNIVNDNGIDKKNEILQQSSETLMPMDIDVSVKVKGKETKREQREKKESRKAKEARESKEGKDVAISGASTLDRRIQPPPYKDQDFLPPKPPALTPASEDGWFECIDHPHNRRGFRYLPCEADTKWPHIMYRQTELPPYGARLSLEDASPHILVTEDLMSCSTTKGFRMIRANVGVCEGDWYFECSVLRGNGEENGHIRVGWARREASLEGPIGFDGYSYGLRDRQGQSVHLSRPKDSLCESIKTGDVVGLRIVLPTKASGDIIRDRIPIRYKGQLYFEQFEYMPTKDMEDLMVAIPMTGKPTPTVIPGSFIEVYKNGNRLGKPFTDLFDVTNSRPLEGIGARVVDDGMLGYFPAFSVFSGGQVRFNPGPTWKFPIPSLPSRPICERFDEQIAEDIVWDIIDELEAEELSEKPILTGAT